MNNERVASLATRPEEKLGLALSGQETTNVFSVVNNVSPAVLDARWTLNIIFFKCLSFLSERKSAVYYPLWKMYDLFCLIQDKPNNIIFWNVLSFLPEKENTNVLSSLCSSVFHYMFEHDQLSVVRVELCLSEKSQLVYFLLRIIAWNLLLTVS